MTRVVILSLLCVVYCVMVSSEENRAIEENRNIFRRLVTDHKTRGLYGMSCTQLGRKCEFDEDCCVGLVCFSSYQSQGVCW